MTETKTAVRLLTEQSLTDTHAPGSGAAAAAVWTETTLSRDAVLARIAALPGDGFDHKHRRPGQRGAGWMLDWLAAQPGATWQDRWLASGAEQQGQAWVELPRQWLQQDPSVQVRYVPMVSSWLHKGVSGLLCTRVLRPGYTWLATCGLHLRRLLEVIDPAFTARARAWMQAEGHHTVVQKDTLKQLARIALHTGRAPGQFTPADLGAYAEAEFTRARRTIGLHALWEVLRQFGVIPADTPPPPSSGNRRRQRRRTVAEQVDVYQLACRPVRDVLVRYVIERAPNLDHSTLRSQILLLAKTFWRDLEIHHPGIDTLRLTSEVAEAWKQRVRQHFTDPYHALFAVRTFYLDLAQWALEDPTWAPWVAPSPVSRQDVQGISKFSRRRTARMHQRTRTLAPVLPTLVRAAEDRVARAEQLLAAAKTATGAFEFEGHCYQRILVPLSKQSTKVRNDRWVRIRDLDSGEVTNATTEEKHAFWAWACIETLRHTGVRIEELLELTHLALSTYRLPDTGEVVPLLQIAPSKTDTERVLLISPELAHVLARIVHRVRDGRPDIPLVSRYDPYEQTDGPPLPHLFQIQNGSQRRVFHPGYVRELLDETAERAGLREPSDPEKPLHLTPHDVRRIFATEAVSGGLPVHIAAKVLGHAQLTTTQAYAAVYQDDVLRHFRAFISRRRAARPSEEYREPTQQEWEAFEQHFTTRKLELGTCGRPYGLPCQHEHACVRCPMLRVDPVQEPRLRQIIDNLAERIAEAKQRGWLGEVEGLQVSLAAAKQKLENMQRARSRQGVTLLGTPIVRSSAQRLS